MKYRTTAKAIRQEAYNPIAVGYCELQWLLYFEEPSAYTCGVYGWNFDVYNLDGATICTGYRGMVGKRVNYELVRDYDTRARHIICENIENFDKRKECVRALLREFLAAVA